MWQGVVKIATHPALDGVLIDRARRDHWSLMDVGIACNGHMHRLTSEWLGHRCIWECVSWVQG